MGTFRPLRSTLLLARVGWFEGKRTNTIARVWRFFITTHKNIFIQRLRQIEASDAIEALLQGQEPKDKGLTTIFVYEKKNDFTEIFVPEGTFVHTVEEYCRKRNFDLAEFLKSDFNIIEFNDDDVADIFKYLYEFHPNQALVSKAASSISKRGWIIGLYMKLTEDRDEI